MKKHIVPTPSVGRKRAGTAPGRHSTVDAGEARKATSVKPAGTGLIDREKQQSADRVAFLQQLLIVAYWWHAGLQTQAPEWVQRHPFWPSNNDIQTEAEFGVLGGKFDTANQGRDRLWEAISTEFGLGL